MANATSDPARAMLDADRAAADIVFVTAARHGDAADTVVAEFRGRSRTVGERQERG